ncbi:MAG: hypothetical protein MUF38_11940, partial [Anaerolineae bacterium]|nr:hypothetical protein [Anaerolineae bacterium]
GTLIGLLLIWVIMISQIKMDEISVRVWKKEDGYTTDIIWKTLSNQLILRQRVGDIVLSDARTMNEAALKAAIFIGYYDLSPNLKSKIDAAFKTYPVPELKKSREYILLLGISLTTLVVVVLMWSLAGAMSIIFGLLSYFVIFFNVGKWALRRSKLALYMTTDFERLHLASYIFEESYNFFKSNVWLQILSPFTLVKPKQQMYADLFLAATTFMYMHQPYESLKRYEQVLEEFPNEPETTWLVNVIKHIGVSPQVD